jgi:hypothetical protein
VVGHPTPADADPTGAAFCFEKGATKHGGGDGFADVWKQGFFGWEYKGKRKDLDAAYDQLLRYKDALENPPLLVTCDLDRFVIRTNFTYTAPATFEFRLDDMAEPRNIEILRAVFFKRDTWLLGSDPHDRKPRNLTRLYNENPSWLQMTHERLDKTVFAAYGWEPSIDIDEILRELLALNALRSTSLSPVAAE